MYIETEQKVAQVRDEKDDPDAAPTIFHGLISSNLSDAEKTDEKMIDESRVLLAAGTDTTARVLSVISYHLLSDPERLKKLKTELETVLPDSNSLLKCAQVETLPYLVSRHRFSKYSIFCLSQNRML